MAARVNKRFLINLTAIVSTAAVAIAVITWVVLRRSAADLVNLGDKWMAQKDYYKAERFYSRAVYKDQGNIEYLRKWRDAMEHKLAPTQTEYAQDFSMYVGGVMRSLAIIQRTNLEAHREYLDGQLEWLRSSNPGRQGWLDFASRVENDTLRYFEAEANPDPKWPWFKRYRAMAYVTLMASASDLSDEQIAQARADLEGAIAVEPADAEASITLARWCMNMSDRARRGDKQADADALRAQARGVLEAAAKADPDSPEIILALLQMDMDAAITSIPQGLLPREQAVARREAIQPFKPRLASLGELMRRVGPDKTRLETVGSFATLWQVIDPQGAKPAATEVLDSFLRAKPDDAEILFSAAMFTPTDASVDPAIARFKKIVELPRLPTSLDGMRLQQMRPAAVVRQVDLAFIAWSRGDAAEKEKRLAQMVEGRAGLAAMLPDGAPPLRLADAKIKYAQGDLTACQQLLTEFNSITQDSNIEALKMTAQVALDRKQTGVAKDTLAKVIAAQPFDSDARIVLADIEIGLQNYSAALQHVEAILAMDGGNAAAVSRREIIQAKLGVGKASDPIVQAIVEAEAVALGSPTKLAEPQQAATMLRDAIGKLGPDPRLSRALAVVLNNAGDAEGARAAAAEGLAANPDNEPLKALSRSLTAASSYEAALEVIAQGTGTELDKALQSYATAKRFGKEPEAATHLAKARELGPRDERVVEMLFVEALDAKRMDEARSLAETAIAGNLDRVDGKTYEARLLVAEGKYEEAALALDAAVKKGSATVGAWQLLGSVQLQLGRSADAVNSYRTAFGIRPNDPELLVAYLRALAQVNQTQTALDEARKNEPIGRTNPEFVDVWLTLEALVGDRDVAMARREQWLKQNPADARNKLALAMIYTDARRWADARKLIDQIRAEADSLEAAILTARWHAEQADIEGARAAFVDYITRQNPDTMTSAPYLAFGRFMLDRGQPELGLTALRQAIPHQDPAKREAERVYADALFQAGRYAEALDQYRATLAAGYPDDGANLRKRLVECLVQLEQFAEAEKQAVALGAQADSDLSLLLLRAQAARGRGDSASSDRLIEQAVAKYPSNPLVYFKRAESKIGDPAQIRAVITDLDEALRIQPSFWEALRARAIVRYNAGEVDAALADLRQAVAINPKLDDLRSQLMRELVMRGRAAEAMDVAEAAIKARPADVQLAFVLGNVFDRTGEYARAERFYRVVWQTLKNDPARRREVAGFYVNACLRATPPLMNEATGVLATPDLGIEQSATLLMLRSRLSTARGRADLATADAKSAFLVASTAGPDALNAWYGDLMLVLPKPADALALLDSIDTARAGDEWGNLFRARLLVRGSDTQSQAMALVEESLPRAKAPLVRVELLRLHALDLYGKGQYEPAAAAMLEAVNLSEPGSQANTEMRNNLAYVLAKHLNKPAEALPHAEAAGKAQPFNPDVLDTLGYVQMLTGKLDEANTSLQKAYQSSTHNAQRVPVVLHLAELHLRKNDKARALEWATRAQELLVSDPGLASHKAEVEQMLERIRAN